MDNTTDNNTTMSGMEVEDDDSMEVVTSWTPIWVTLLISCIQGILFYSFFLYRRRKDSILFHIETEKLLTSGDGGGTGGTGSTATTSTNTNTMNEEALQHCQLYESRQYTRSHRSPAPFESTTMTSTTTTTTTTTTGPSNHPDTTNHNNKVSWWKSTLAISNDDLLRYVGLDTYMFLRLLYIGTRITGCGSFLSLILLPIYATGTEKGITTEQFNLLTIARVESDGSSWRLYIAVMVWYIFITFVLYEFWYEWKLYYIYRTTFDAVGDIDMPIEYRYTVRMERVPITTNTDTQLRMYLEKLFPKQIYETATVFNTKELEKRIDQRQKIILKLETCIAAMTSSTKANAKMKQIKVKGHKVDAIPYYESEIERYNQEIDTMRHTILKSGSLSSFITSTVPNNNDDVLSSSLQKQVPNEDNGLILRGNNSSSGYQSQQEEGVETGLDMKLSSTSVLLPPPVTTTTTAIEDTKTNKDVTTSTAFVTFTSLRAKQAAIQCELSGDPDTMIVFPVSDPTVGMIWKNVTVSLPIQMMCQFYASCFFIIGILFWAIPVSFVTSISNLNSILEAFGLKQANPSVFWYGLVAGLLPVIMLAVLMIVLYMVITAAATNFIRYKSWPEVDAYCLYWHTLFQFANLWLILIGGSLFNQIDSIIEEPEFKPIIETIALAMPGASVFFVNMIICSSFNAFGMELSMLVKYIVTMILNIIIPEASQTQRQLDEKKKPPSLVWGQKVPPIIFIFMVSILYMPIVPIISIFAFVYFLGTYIVMKHQCVHVYAQEFEGGGSATWQQVFGFLMGCVYIGELIFIVYMGLKTAPIQSGLGLVPFIVTCAFHRILYRKYIEPIQNLSLQVAGDVDFHDGELSHENRADTTIQTLYRQPVLDRAQEERGPMPYRRKPVVPRSSTEAV